MTDENRKDQDKQEELTEKDLDQASGGARVENRGRHEASLERSRHNSQDGHSK